MLHLRSYSWLCENYPGRNWEQDSHTGESFSILLRDFVVTLCWCGSRWTLESCTPLGRGSPRRSPVVGIRGRPRRKPCRSFSLVEALNGGQQGRALISKTPLNVDFLSTAFAPMPLAPDLQNTRRARMTWRPLVAECRDGAACLRANVLSNGPQSIPRPDTTESKTLQVELQRTPQPTSANQKRATNRRNRETFAEQPRAHQSGHH